MRGIMNLFIVVVFMISVVPKASAQFVGGGPGSVPNQRELEQQRAFQFEQESRRQAEIQQVYRSRQQAEMRQQQAQREADARWRADEEGRRWRETDATLRPELRQSDDGHGNGGNNGNGGKHTMTPSGIAARILAAMDECSAEELPSHDVPTDHPQWKRRWHMAAMTRQAATGDTVEPTSTWGDLVAWEAARRRTDLAVPRWMLPFEYDYGIGGNIVWDGGRVRLGVVDVGSVAEWLDSAAKISQSGGVPPDFNCGPFDFGTFAIVDDADRAEPPTIVATLWLKLTPSLRLEGEFIDSRRPDWKYDIYGGLDVWAGRVVLQVDRFDGLLFETGITNLTRPETLILVHEPASQRSADDDRGGDNDSDSGNIRAVPEMRGYLLVRLKLAQVVSAVSEGGSDESVHHR